jgi:hypothetical protein
MGRFFGGQSGLRLVIGTVIVLFAWGLYAVRLATGVGPMRDHEGNQAPAAHYLVGALMVSGMVVVWVVVRGMMGRGRRGE